MVEKGQIRTFKICTLFFSGYKMQVLLACLLLLGSVTAQNLIRPSLYNYRGTFSKSGVFSLVRTTVNGIPSQSLDLGTGFQASIDDSQVDNESSLSTEPWAVSSQLYVFVLVDASGSQQAYLSNVVSNLTTLISTNLANNGYQNVTIATAYFDGQNGYQMLKDWTTNVDSALSAIYDKFSNGNYKATDPATNLNGAYIAAHQYVRKKILSQSLLTTVPQGLIIFTGDGKDTAQSSYAPGSNSVNEVDPNSYLSSNQLSNFWLQSGASFSNPFSNPITYSSALVNSSTDVASLFTNHFSTKYNNSNAGYWLVKLCTATRPVSYDYNKTLAQLVPSYNPDYHTATFQLNAGFQSTPVTVAYNASSFSRGCDIGSRSFTVYNDYSSASLVSVSVALFALLALFL
ncbi:hypothetical protein PROFUN_15006 [Planoprotostelium fungivorum]|uniref:VWFA domain-containing protein n=1 Tax=Planoprotostelium fungivorum TaxID=1890364 RepID=A0A2P6MY03_9EUKA|nr:hypothetical protein PROFUN_15006 [Planoprotostelium fungivorum]